MKPFDCVEMKRVGAKAVQRRIEAMTLAEELAFWQQQTQQLKQDVAARQGVDGIQKQD